MRIVPCRFPENKILLLGGRDRQTKRLTDFHVSRVLPSGTLWDPFEKSLSLSLLEFDPTEAARYSLQSISLAAKQLMDILPWPFPSSSLIISFRSALRCLLVSRPMMTFPLVCAGVANRREGTPPQPKAFITHARAENLTILWSWVVRGEGKFLHDDGFVVGI